MVRHRNPGPPSSVDPNSSHAHVLDFWFPMHKAGYQKTCLIGLPCLWEIAPKALRTKCYGSYLIVHMVLRSSEKAFLNPILVMKKQITHPDSC